MSNERFRPQGSPAGCKKEAGRSWRALRPQGSPAGCKKKKRAAYGDPLSCRRIQDMQLMSAVPDGYYVFTGTAVFLWLIFLF